MVRLKDKLGNRSNASSELELDGTLAQRLGDEGRGVRTIIEMVAATRLDCVLGSAALMRHALAEASWHVAHRSAFGGLLVDKPLMQNVVADLAVESEAATALAMRLAAAVDRPGDPHEVALRRIALPLAKFWVCKRTPAMVAEALECLGGNGYVEESGLPLMFRESPLNSIWEGSGNVNALDVLRALGREPEVLQAWITEVGAARGADSRLDRAVDDTLALLGEGAGLEAGARRLAGRMAACLQGSLLVRFAPAEVADAFCGSRFGTSYGGTFGMLTAGRCARSSTGRTPADSDRPDHWPHGPPGPCDRGRRSVRRIAEPADGPSAARRFDRTHTVWGCHGRGGDDEDVQHDAQRGDAAAARRGHRRRGERPGRGQLARRTGDRLRRPRRGARRRRRQQVAGAARRGRRR